MLTVEDDGNGMTLDRFKTAFLRIAGRDKEQGFRRASGVLQVKSLQMFFTFAVFQIV